MNNETLHRLSAFADGSEGGNPAGVWVGETLPDPDAMQRIAADVGYSETAFVAPLAGPDREIRYFSPEGEVTFCGHATIATGVVLGRSDGEGTYQLTTRAGIVPVSVGRRNDRVVVSLRSVDPRHQRASEILIKDVLEALAWKPSDIDYAIPPAKAYAGAWHLVLAVSSASRLAELHYDFDALKALMLRENLTTLQLVWRERDDLFHSRNPFPVGGVIEDPATGASAAALGGYLRDAGLARAPVEFFIRQGETMGRPSLLTVDVPVSGGIVVSGSALDI